MEKNALNPKVDRYLTDGCMQCKLGGTPKCKIHDWQNELNAMRKYLLDCGLTEDFKWRNPCYTVNNKNIAILHLFNEYAALTFFKGALLKDPENILIQQTKNMQAARQLRFANLADIQRLESTIKAYVFQAVEVEKQGLKIEYKSVDEYETPVELTAKFEEDQEFQAAFEALTPGRQKGYLLHFSKPKQSKTRKSRIEKSAPKIYQGKGVNER